MTMQMFTDVIQSVAIIILALAIIALVWWDRRW